MQGAPKHQKPKMTSNTREAVRAILAADSTIDPELATAAMKLLSGKTEKEAPLGRVVKSREAAKRCGVTTQTLRDWARAGIIKPVYAGRNVQRLGYTEESIRALLEGRAGEPKTRRA